MNVTSISWEGSVMNQKQILIISIKKYLEQQCPASEEIAEELLRQAQMELARAVIEEEELEELRAYKKLYRSLGRTLQ